MKNEKVKFINKNWSNEKQLQEAAFHRGYVF
jgi:hypothetical protein